MAAFWVGEYHVDGFRIDAFADIDNWDFVQAFRDHAHAEHDRQFPGRPFLVIAEDSGRRAEITQDRPGNPQSAAPPAAAARCSSRPANRWPHSPWSPSRSASSPLSRGLIETVSATASTPPAAPPR